MKAAFEFSTFQTSHQIQLLKTACKLDQYRMSTLQNFQEKTITFLHSTNGKLTLTAVAASAVTATTIFSVQKIQRHIRSRRLKKTIHEVTTKTTVLNAFGTVAQSTELHRSNATTHEFDESLIKEQLARNYAFLGEDGVEKVRRSFVVVVGAGGVGSWVASMLVRSGVEHIRVVDFDQVTLSSLNRHSVAEHGDVGTPKVMAMKKHFKNIAPHAKIDAKVELFNEESAERLLAGVPNFVVDAIDNIDTKVALLKYCHDHNLPCVSSMGAGAKADPSRIQLADISETFEDPLARVVRRRLKKLGVDSGITVAYSTEKPSDVKLLELDESQVSEATEFATLPDFRVRILPVLGTLPAMFGMALATHIILKLADFPIQPLPIKLRDSLYQRLHKELVGRENRLYSITSIPLTIRDVGYIFEEIWRGRSAISGSMDKPVLSRWNKTKPISFDNVVCMTRTEVEQHELFNGSLEEEFSRETIEFVEKRFREERQIRDRWDLP